MNDWDGRAPITLARDAPVAQAPSRLARAQAQRLELARDRINGLHKVQPVIFARVNQTARLLVRIGFMPHLVIKRLVANLHYLRDR